MLCRAELRNCPAKVEIKSYSAKLWCVGGNFFGRFALAKLDALESWSKVRWNEGLEKSILRPTVGRRKNLLRVVDATYRRSSRRPTVGFFLPPLRGAGNKGFWRELDRLVEGKERIDQQEAPSTLDLLEGQGVILSDLA